jgi:hypothetical protein
MRWHVDDAAHVASWCAQWRMAAAVIGECVIEYRACQRVLLLGLCLEVWVAWGGGGASGCFHC